MTEIDLVTIMNLALCIVIAALGYVRYKKSKSKIPLYIGIAFGLFGISHAITLLGIQGMMDILLVIRTLGYVTVVYALSILGNELRKDKKKR